MSLSITVVVPTNSDPRLAKTLWSLDKQLGEHDEVLVIGNGIQRFARWVCSRLENVIYMDGPPCDCPGTQWKWGSLWCAGDCIIYWVETEEVPDDLLTFIRCQLAKERREAA